MEWPVHIEYTYWTGPSQVAPERRFQCDRSIEKNRSKLTVYENFCTELGEEATHIALAWLLSNPIVTAPIIGPRTLSQLDDTQRALDISVKNPWSASVASFPAQEVLPPKPTPGE